MFIVRLWSGATLSVLSSRPKRQDEGMLLRPKRQNNSHPLRPKRQNGATHYQSLILAQATECVDPGQSDRIWFTIRTHVYSPPWSRATLRPQRRLPHRPKRKMGRDHQCQMTKMISKCLKNHWSQRDNIVLGLILAEATECVDSGRSNRIVPAKQKTTCKTTISV